MSYNLNQRRESNSVRQIPHTQGRRTLAEDLKDAIIQDFIISGEIPPGSYLPTEFELVAMYKASRITVRSALSSIQDAGYIARQHGRGSLVLPRPQTLYWGIAQLRSIESYAATQGLEVSTTKLSMQISPMDDETAAQLDCKAGDNAVFVERAKTFDDVVVSWIVDVVPETIVELDRMMNEFRGSVLDVLIADDELNTTYSDCELSAVAANENLANQLEVDTGTPLFFIDELTRSSDGRVLNWSRAWSLNSHFTFNLRRQR